MAKVYLDTNKIIDIIVRDPVGTSEVVAGHQVFASPLSYHVLSYVEKIEMPNPQLLASLGTISTVSLDENILQKSLQGPTSDLEDNFQLNSAAQENCDYFLTNDKKLLKMKFYGRTEIINKL